MQSTTTPPAPSRRHCKPAARARADTTLVQDERVSYELQAGDGGKPKAINISLLPRGEHRLLAAAEELLLSGPKAMTQFVAELYAADPAAREEIKAAGGAKSWLSARAEFDVYQPQPEEQDVKQQEQQEQEQEQ